MKTYLLLSYLSLCCLISFAQTQSKEHLLQFSTTSIIDSFFVSTPIPLISDQPNPFLYVSVYTEDPYFKGSVFIRTAIQNEWSEWFLLSQVPQEEYGERVVLQGRAIPIEVDQIQFKTTEWGQIPLRCRVFMPGTSAVQINSAVSSRGNPLPCEQPPICNRDCWCPTGNCPTDPTPVSTTVTHIIVHHSAANTRSADFPAVVRSYWDFHVNARGWDDIGYNWLIDANGVIYEGRGEERLGAHFSCMNEKTVGICLIGNFENERPTPAALAALQDFVAWEAHKGAIDVSKQGYHASSQLELEFMAGHRDGGASLLACSSTVCPGDSLYEELPILRSLIATNSCSEETADSTILTNTNQIRIIENISLFPNPAKEYLTVSFDSKSSKEISLSMVGVNGKEYPLGVTKIEEGKNIIPINLPSLPKGVFCLNIVVDRLMTQRKFFVMDDK